MTLLQLAVLSLVQGITEFLPISSSAHLILVPAVTDWPDQSLVIDVAVHVGTLGAVLVYFWRDVVHILGGFFRLLIGRMTEGGRLFLLLVLASVPLVVAGGVVHLMGWDAALRSVAVIGWATLVFGIVLYLADRLFMTVLRVEDMAWTGALFVGLAQVLALIPGTSRSGITMTAARMLGFQRTDAARFSMLLSIPAIIAPGVLLGAELAQAGDTALGADAVLAASLSFIFALLAIALLMAWLRRAGFLPFVVYRVALGLALLAWVYVL